MQPACRRTALAVTVKFIVAHMLLDPDAPLCCQPDQRRCSLASWHASYDGKLSLDVVAHLITIAVYGLALVWRPETVDCCCQRVRGLCDAFYLRHLPMQQLGKCGCTAQDSRPRHSIMLHLFVPVAGLA